MNIRFDKDGNELLKGESPRTQGGYMYRFTDSKGKRHSIYADTLEELRLKRNEIRTLDQIFIFWLTERNLKESGKVYYQNIYKFYIHLYFEGFAISDIRLENIKSFQKEILENTRISNERKIEIFQVCQSLFLWGIKSNYLSKEFKELFQNRKWGKARFLTPGPDVLEIIKTEMKIDPVLKVTYISLLLKIPVDAVLGLTWQDVDLVQNIITVNKKVSYYDNSDRKIHIISLSEIRKISFEGDLRNDVMDALYPMPDRIISKPIDGVYGFIFVSDSGTIFTKKRINNALRLMNLRREDNVLYTCASFEFYE